MPDNVYVNSDDTLEIPFSHNTRQMVPELSVSSASCLQSALPLDITVALDLGG